MGQPRKDTGRIQQIACLIFYPFLLEQRAAPSHKLLTLVGGKGDHASPA